MNKTIIFLFLFSLLLLAACATKNDTPATTDAAAYILEGEEYFEKGQYQDAISSWMKVKDSYYTPELNILAELKIAEAYFLDEQYIEAAVAYEAFLVSHPNNARVPDVLYQLGLSYSYQMLGFDQDQTATINALKAFTTLKERFPQDRRSEVLQTYIENCRNQLAASDLNIGQFYLVTKDYSAAINRIEGLLMKYPNFYNRDKAYFYLGQAYMMVGDNEKADMAFNTLFNDYSNSDYIPDARDFIETNQ